MVCRLCRTVEGMINVEDKHRKFWLDRFTDDEIAYFASCLSGRKITPDMVSSRWPRRG